MGVTTPRAHTVPPSVANIIAVATSLGDTVKEIVFIGGAVAPLLQTDRVIPLVRATRDVDAVIASTSYSTHATIEDQLRSRGFRQALDTTHLHRWMSPDGIPFDLVPTGDFLGGSGARWDVIAAETAARLELVPGLVIQHVSAPTFLALKWAAFRDRGSDNPFDSHDLEDILALIASRPGIVEEVHKSPSEVREFTQENFAFLMESEDFADLLGAHLNNAYSPRRVTELVAQRIAELSVASI